MAESGTRVALYAREVAPTEPDPEAGDDLK